MSSRVEQAIAEEVKELVDSRLFMLRFNMQAALRGIFWDDYLHGKVPESLFGEIDKLVNTTFDTSYMAGPTNEPYPSFDRTEIQKIGAKIKLILDQRKLPT